MMAVFHSPVNYFSNRVFSKPTDPLAPGVS